MAKQARKKPATKKKKKASKKSDSKSKRTSTKSKTKPLAKSNSVDAILNKYQKARVNQAAKLKLLRTRIEGLESKVKSFRTQIQELGLEEKEIQKQLDEHDAKRDQEVSDLLIKLGIRVSSSPSTKTSGTHTTDAIEQDDDLEDSDDSEDLDEFEENPDETIGTDRRPFGSPRMRT